jgi:ribosomal protein L31E
MIESQEIGSTAISWNNELAMTRSVKKIFYPTWKQAAAAVQKIPGIVSQLTYYELYKSDSMLPGVPYRHYANFPGWDVFLGREKKRFYSTWRGASRAVRKIEGITTQKLYRQLYIINPRLPSTPCRYYANFPGWKVFLGGKDFYSNWKQAARAARKIDGIVNQFTYIKLYKNNSRLPSSPEKFYANFPGWKEFLGNRMKSHYSTWKRASIAAQKIPGIVSQSTYRQLYKVNPKLSSAPYRYYADFPGWDVFLGKK